jgi:hypothetical protein
MIYVMYSPVAPDFGQLMIAYSLSAQILGDVLSHFALHNYVRQLSPLRYVTRALCDYQPEISDRPTRMPCIEESYPHLPCFGMPTREAAHPEGMTLDPGLSMIPFLTSSTSFHFKTPAKAFLPAPGFLFSVYI